MTTKEQHIEDAARILSTYIIDATRGVRFDVQELRAELRTAVEHIVDAAASEAVDRVADPTPPATVTVTGVDPYAGKLQPGERDERD